MEQSMTSGDGLEVSCYLIFTDQQTGTDCPNGAGKTCKNAGGQAVSLNTQEEYEYVNLL
jgi:hypothetical protein